MYTGSIPVLASTNLQASTASIDNGMRPMAGGMAKVTPFAVFKLSRQQGIGYVHHTLAARPRPATRRRRGDQAP